MEFKVIDKRGQEELKEVCRVCGSSDVHSKRYNFCRVCGSSDVHSKRYNLPTMDCIKYLRSIISDLKGE